MPLDWPALNSLAWLRLPCCGAEHPTRVEDFDGDSCVVAEPVAPHQKPVDPGSVSEGFFLGWVIDGGAFEVPVALLKSETEPVPTWTLVAQGPGTNTQRRNFVRLAMEQPIQLFILEGGMASNATLLDISEGGLRCRIDQWVTDPGSRVIQIRVGLDTRDFYLRGQVVWWGKQDSSNMREIGIRFVDVEDSVADSIRSYIFAAQLAERRKRMQ